jgi:hypothetical protein
MPPHKGRRELDHFIGAIASGMTPLAGGSEGVQALALADAALASRLWRSPMPRWNHFERAARSGSDQPILASIPKRTAPGWGEPGARLSEAFGGNLAP